MNVLVSKASINQKLTNKEEDKREKKINNKNNNIEAHNRRSGRGRQMYWKVNTYKTR